MTSPPSWRELGALLGAAVAVRSYFKGDKGTAAAAALGASYCVWKMYQAGELGRRVQEAQQLAQSIPTRARVPAGGGQQLFPPDPEPSGGGVNLS